LSVHERIDYRVLFVIAYLFCTAINLQKGSQSNYSVLKVNLDKKDEQLNAADRKKIYYLLSVDFSNSLNYLERLVNLIKENPIKEVSTENATWIVHSLFVLAYFPENFEKALSLIENLLLIKIFPKKSSSK